MPETLTVTVPVATVWTGPDAPRPLDEAAVRDSPDCAAWSACLSGEAERAGLNGRTLTQLLLGDPVQVLEEHGDWLQVVAPGQPSSMHPDGYPGWVRRAHLGERRLSPDAGLAWTAVRRLTAPCTLEDGSTLMLSFGTLVEVESDAPFRVTAGLPDGRRGTIARSDVRVGEDAVPGVGPLEAARVFLGTRYLWGGTSGWGPDCSGLVHLAFRLFGTVVPRDAKDQATSPGLRDVPLDEVRPGDLYFFAEPGKPVHHVGFASRPVAHDGSRWMLHAPGVAGWVEDAPMTQDRLRTLVGAGRFEASSPSAY